MPVHKVKLPDGTTGYQWGRTGKIYKDPRKAYAQGAAIQHAQQRRGQSVQKVAAYENALRKVAWAPVTPQIARGALMPSTRSSSWSPGISLQDHEGFAIHGPRPGSAYGTPQQQLSRTIYPAANAAAQPRRHIPRATPFGDKGLYKSTTQFNGSSIYKPAPGHDPRATDQRWYYDMIDRGQVFDAQGKALTREEAIKFGSPTPQLLDLLRSQTYDTRLGTAKDPGNQQQRRVLQWRTNQRPVLSQPDSGKPLEGVPYLQAVANPSFALKDNSRQYYNPEEPTAARWESVKNAQKRALQLQQKQQREWQEQQQQAYQGQLERQRKQTVVQPRTTAKVQQQKAAEAEATSQAAPASPPLNNASATSHTAVTRPDRPQQQQQQVQQQQQQTPPDPRGTPAASVPATAPARRTWKTKDGITIVRSEKMMKWLNDQRTKTQQHNSKLRDRAKAHTDAITNGNKRYAAQQQRRAEAQQEYRADQRERAARVRQSFGRPPTPSHMTSRPNQLGRGNNARKMPRSLTQFAERQRRFRDSRGQ